MSTPTTDTPHPANDFGWNEQNVKQVPQKQYKHIAYVTAGILMISEEAYERMLALTTRYNLH